MLKCADPCSTAFVLPAEKRRFSPQVVYRIFEDADLKPLLDAVNEEAEKEKEREA